MVTVRQSLVVGSAVLVLLLAALMATVGLGFLGWGVGLACAAVAAVALTRASPPELGPADLITLARVLLTCANCRRLARALISDDFPTLERPTTATSAGEGGSCDNFVADFTNDSCRGEATGVQASTGCGSASARSPSGRTTPTAAP